MCVLICTLSKRGSGLTQGLPYDKKTYLALLDCQVCNPVVFAKMYIYLMVGILQFPNILFLFPNLIVVGLDLQNQAKMGEVNATQDTLGLNSSSSLSCNDSCMTSTTKARKNSASEGSLVMLT